MTLQENVVEEYMSRAMREWDANPLAASFLRRLSNEAPVVFLEEAMKHLKSSENSGAHRFLTLLALRQDALTSYLATPSLSTRAIAVSLFRRFLEVDPSFDVKLARRLPDRSYTNHAVAFDVSRSTRALDILDATSRGRRLLPILGHLPNSREQRLAAKATLFVGRRLQSPAWSAKLMASDDQRVRANALEAIWGLDSQAAVQLLEKCTEDKNHRVVGNALLGLHIVRHRDIETELLALSRDVSPDRRSTSAWVMGKTAQECWTGALTAMVRDEHPGVRGMAIRSLREIRERETVLSESVAPAEQTEPATRDEGRPAERPDGYIYNAFPQYRYAR